MKARRLIRATVPASLTSLLLLGGQSTAQQPPTPVRVDPVRTEEIQDMRFVTGELRSAHRSVLAAREPGMLLELLVREGSVVEQGQVLARLDTKQLELEVAIIDAQSELAVALLRERRATAEQAQSDLEILRELAARDAINPKELTDAETQARVTTARVIQAEEDAAVLRARRALLVERISDMQPRAPFAGVVVARHSEVGQWVGEGGELVEIVAVDQLEAWLDLPQFLYAAVSRYQGAISISLDAEGEGAEGIEAKEWRLVPSIDSRGRTFSLIAAIPATNPSSPRAIPGMSISAAVPTGARAEHLTVARAAVLRSETGPYVYVAQSMEPEAPPVAMLVPVEILFSASERVAVRSPRLHPGAQVVVEGNERLFPMAPLQTREATRK